MAEQLTFEEILFLMEWRLVLVVKVLGKLIDKHREVDQAIRNKNAHKEHETKRLLNCYLISSSSPTRIKTSRVFKIFGLDTVIYLCNIMFLPPFFSS